MSAPALASYPIPVGISDDHPAALQDPRLAALQLTMARLVVPWDAVDSEPALLDQWITNADAGGYEIQVAFEHSLGDDCPRSPCTLPTVAEYSAAFSTFHNRYPQVTVIAPWNEANHATQPTANAPGHAAWYYDAVATDCPTCTVVAADVLAGQSGLASWLATFQAHAEVAPKLWGLHNYGDVNRFATTDTDAFLAMVDGDVWLTETGGIVSFDPDGQVVFAPDESRAARAVGFALELARDRPDRIKRIYLYNWAAGTLAWDSGFVRPDGSLRPSYTELADVLGVSLAAPPLSPPIQPSGPSASPAPAAGVTKPSAGTTAASEPGAAHPGQRTPTRRSPLARGRVKVAHIDVGRSGSARLAVSCSATTRCRLRLRLVVAHSTFRRSIVVAAHTRRLVRFRLSPAVVRMLRIRTRLTAHVHTSAGPATAESVLLVWTPGVSRAAVPPAVRG